MAIGTAPLCRNKTRYIQGEPLSQKFPRYCLLWVCRFYWGWGTKREKHHFLLALLLRAVLKHWLNPGIKDPLDRPSWPVRKPSYQKAASFYEFCSCSLSCNRRTSSIGRAGFSAGAPGSTPRTPSSLPSALARRGRISWQLEIHSHAFESHDSRNYSLGRTIYIAGHTING